MLIDNDIIVVINKSLADLQISTEGYISKVLFTEQNMTDLLCQFGVL